jgi:hypothetical protein
MKWPRHKAGGSMKKIIMAGFIVFVGGLLSLQITQAQGTVYLSNLNQPSTYFRPVGSNSWFAAEFETGNNPGGYTLNSIQLAMTNAAGNPSGFTVMIYNGVSIPSGAGIFRPGSSLGILDGTADPSTAGIYSYTGGSSLLLSPSTNYFIVVTAGTFFLMNAYKWSLADTSYYNSSGGFLEVSFYSSINGSSWNVQDAYPQFAINATPVPEPTPSLLLLFGSGIFVYVRRDFLR